MPAAGLLIVRIVLAAVLIAHGAHDVFGTFESPAIGHGGLAARAAYMASIGLTPGSVFAMVGGVSELAGGALLALGFFTRAVALVLLAFQAVLLWKDAWN